MIIKCRYFSCKDLWALAHFIVLTYLPIQCHITKKGHDFSNKLGHLLEHSEYTWPPAAGPSSVPEQNWNSSRNQHPLRARLEGAKPGGVWLP